MKHYQKDRLKVGISIVVSILLIIEGGISGLALIAITVLPYWIYRWARDDIQLKTDEYYYDDI